MSLAAYLTSKYLTAEPATTRKKRKRKNHAAASGLTIADDDDALGWNSHASHAAPDESDTPLTVISGSAEFRKVKKNPWKTVGLAALNPRDSDADQADQIIAQAAAENSAAQQQDESPMILDPAVVKMGDGTHAGLQTASAVAEQIKHRRQEEKAAWQAEMKASKSQHSEETVYRDATGRRIDLTMRRQEALREAKAKAAKEREKLEEQKGDVQRMAREKRKAELDDAKFIPLTRTIEDEEMNKELKERDRWNDPALQFMSQTKNGKRTSGKPLYAGAAAPNRYGIRPGHKWDGVDRSNGWEGYRFKTLNKAARNKDLSYSWQMDE